MVSVVGRTTAAATTDRDGRYSLRALPYGPYILSVHSRGYFKSRGRTVQLTTSKVSIPEIQLQLASARKVPVIGRGTGGRRDSAPGDAARGVWIGSIATGLRTPVRGSPEEESGRARGDGVAPAASAAQHPEGCGSRGGVGGGRVPTSTMVQPPFGRGVRPNRVLQRPSVVWTAQSDDDRVVRSTGRDFRRARAAQRGVCLGQHAGCRRRVVDAGRDDAGRSGVVDCRRLLQVDRIDEPRVRARVSPTARSATMAATPLRSAPFARAPATSAASTDTTSGRVSPRLVIGYGTGYARYDYLGGPGVWSPRLSITLPAEGFRLKALASRKALVPGAEEFAPSVTGMWLPPERTFSSLSHDGRFTPEHVRHMQISLERDLASGVTVSRARLRSARRESAD